MQAPHEVPRPRLLGAIAPRGLERQLAPPGLHLRPEGGFVVTGGVLQRGVDDRAQTGRRAAGRGTDDLEELIADRHQRVVQAELGDAGVLEAHGDAQEGAELGDGAVTIGGDEGHLAEADHERRP